ncbi:MAG: prepilin-type N-terminal cleavage/methylation protein [Acidimicrobiales bacterium]|nr:prepilin-type N-terminal cleavage/methylation protein [Acidimicrobiales bacterium]
MLNTLTNLRKREDGFTLIELMIVMVVLGILAGIVLFGVGTFSGDAGNSRDAANTRQCQTATAAWHAANPTLTATNPTAAQLGTYFASGTAPCP